MLILLIIKSQNLELEDHLDVIQIIIINVWNQSFFPIVFLNSGQRQVHSWYSVSFSCVK